MGIVLLCHHKGSVFAVPVLNKLSEAKDEDIKCITDHPGFSAGMPHCMGPSGSIFTVQTAVWQL